MHQGHDFLSIKRQSGPRVIKQDVSRNANGLFQRHIRKKASDIKGAHQASRLIDGKFLN